MTIIIEYIQHIVVTILIGYIGLTNSLATFVESALVDTDDTYSQETMSDGAFERIVAVASKYTESTSRVLLDNAKFQHAATIASMHLDTEHGEIPALPIEDAIARALVNIYCQYKTDTHIRTTTGTGFIINPKGVILTNAHVAQFLLLEGTEDVVSDVECVIRTGNPAVAKYTAELLYISPTWIFENASLVDNEAPRGTGERDYALLYISNSTDGTPLPTSFSSIPTDTQLLPRSIAGASVHSAGYPAEKLIQNGSDTDLEPVIAQTTIETLYTFGSNFADIFSVSGSPVGEQGASGGPVVTDIAHAIGLIVTKGDEVTEGRNSLRALTLSYIDRTITEETGFSLAQNMMGDVALRGNVFMEAIGPFLTQLLKNELRN